MKTINELEQEAQQAREDVALALAEVLPYGTGSVIADKLILASVAMVTYQFALAKNLENGEIVSKKILVGENCNEHCGKEEYKIQSDLSESEQIKILKKANAELRSKLSKSNIENGD